MESLFFKVVCETIDVFEKAILIDKNCKDMDEVKDIVLSHPEFVNMNTTWILYPMFVKL